MVAAVIEVRVVNVHWELATFFLKEVKGNHLSPVHLDIFVFPEPLLTVLLSVKKLVNFVFFAPNFIVYLLVRGQN